MAFLKHERLYFPPYFLPARSRQCSPTNNFQSFCVTLTFVDGLHDQVSYIQGRFWYQVMIYDIMHQQFIGNILTGKAVNEKNGKIPLNEILYFYTSINCNELLLIVEVVHHLVNTDLARTIAWTGIPLSTMKDRTFISPNSIQYRVPLHSGSPVALYFMGGILEKLNHGENVTGLELLLSVSAHPLLMKVIHLVPENVLLRAGDSLPGLCLPSQELLAHDCLNKPQLQKCITYVLGNITLKVVPALADVETEILRKMSEERASMTDSSLHTFSEATIVQRHLKIGAHNGLCYIQEPDFYRLLVEPVVSPGIASQTHRCSSSTLSFSQEECLTLRSDVKIPNVPDDPNIMLVLLIEYAVSFLSSYSDIHPKSSLGRSPTSTVSILWGLCPLSPVARKSNLSTFLTCDANFCPDKVLFLKTSSSNKFELMYSLLSSTKKVNQFGQQTKDILMLSENQTPTQLTPGSQCVALDDHIVASSLLTSFQLSEKDLLSHGRSTSNSIQQSKERKFVESQCIDSQSAFKETEMNAAMEEVTIVPSSIPLFSPAVSSFHGRVSFPSTAKHFVQFPDIYDRHGQTPSCIDPTLPLIVNEEKEFSQPPQGNEITFQFLGISGVCADFAAFPNSLFFTFQFYRFPPVKTESLLLKPVNAENSASSSSFIYIIPSSQVNNEKAHGYQVTYCIDPSELSAGEYRPFHLFLARGNILIHVWNAESLLYFGTIIVPLKYLCRQGKEAVSINLDLDIVYSEFPDDAPGQTIPFSMPSRGCLHLRMVNIKVPMLPKSLTKFEEVQVPDTILVSSKKEVRSKLGQSNLIIKAMPILETNSELVKLMATRPSLITSNVALPESFLSEERKRKLARMETVRSFLRETSLTHSFSKDMQNFIRERQRDLLVIESYIEKNKLDMIHSFLESSVTVEKTIYPVLGEKHYFEFELLNPYQSDQNVQITWKSSELSLVTDAKEQQFLQEKSGLFIKSGKPLFCAKHESWPSIILHPRDKVSIPFMYQRFIVDSENQAETFKAFSGYHFTTELLNVSRISHCLTPSVIKVSFRTKDQTLVAVLLLKIQPLPPSVTHFFRFLSPEHSIFKKCVRIRSSAEKLQVFCSDREVFCDAWDLSEPKSVLLKANSGTAGKVRTFYMLVYEDSYLCTPAQTWEIFVYSLQRVDLCCIGGQLTRSSLLLRGNHVTNLVKCFSDSDKLQLHPSDTFVLSACAVQELALSIRSLSPGTGYFRISMVNLQLEEIQRLWLLVLTCHKPFVSKAFQVHLSTGKESIKRITFNNPYSENKRYVLLCSHPHLLQLREQQFSIAAQKSHPLGLFFPCQDSAISETVFLYVNDTSDKNEETYCIKVNCK